MIDMSDEINLKPIGRVHSDFINPGEVKLSVGQSTIEVFPEYTAALQRISDHSHIWVLGWFHQANRKVLKVVPRINTGLPEYGVFGLRAFSRPNPIGLTVVKLEKVEDNILTVSDLDFIDGTPILDIKSYYEQDIIFSPTVPYIRPADSKMLEQMIMKQALNHHREKCTQLVLAVKMAILAEKELGQLAADNIKLTVKGSRCLGDTLQGITQAKLANPPRFFFVENGNQGETVWEDGSKVMKIAIKNGVAGMNTEDIEKLTAEQLFAVEYLPSII